MSVNKAKNDLARVQRDIVRLQEQLNQAQALETKIAHYLEMAQRYDNDADVSYAVRSGQDTASSSPERSKASSSGTSFDAVQATVNILRESRKPIRTRDLLPMLEERGIHVGGSNPVTNLSGFLSRSPELVANRALGWHLAVWNESNNEKNADESLAEVL